ncbi:hypothetical protein OSTOST_03527 [Ostertagia ostertagi]
MWRVDLTARSSVTNYSSQSIGVLRRNGAFVVATGVVVIVEVLNIGYRDDNTKQNSKHEGRVCSAERCGPATNTFETCSAGRLPIPLEALVTRVFVSDMTRARMEGLLDAFPKLIGNDKDSAQRQHTFIESATVYAMILPFLWSNCYMIPEYCRSNDEKEILAHDFDLIFAFDEVVTLGAIRATMNVLESVNLAQIRTFTEMDSHEERARTRAAKQAMAEKAKEFKRMQKEALSKGLKPGLLQWNVLDWNSNAIAFYETLPCENLTKKEGWLLYRLDAEGIAALAQPKISTPRQEQKLQNGSE